MENYNVHSGGLGYILTADGLYRELFPKKCVEINYSCVISY